MKSLLPFVGERRLKLFFTVAQVHVLSDNTDELGLFAFIVSKLKCKITNEFFSHRQQHYDQLNMDWQHPSRCNQSSRIRTNPILIQ